MEELIGEKETEDKAKNFASLIKGFKNSLLINLIGNLGAGKTTFVRGLIQELGFDEFVSPRPCQFYSMAKTATLNDMGVTMVRPCLTAALDVDLLLDRLHFSDVSAKIPRPSLHCIVDWKPVSSYSDH